MSINVQPTSLLILIILLVLLCAGGVFGGVAMFIDPTGETLGLPLGLLDGLPISSFVLPGVFLLLVMGVAPLAVAVGLWKRQQWAWWGALAQSILLILWIGLQIVLWGAPVALQTIYLVWGIAMLGLSLLPSVRNHLLGIGPQPAT